VLITKIRGRVLLNFGAFHFARRNEDIPLLFFLSGLSGQGEMKHLSAQDTKKKTWLKIASSRKAEQKTEVSACAEKVNLPKRCVSHGDKV
jgi:hypothetical protein